MADDLTTVLRFEGDPQGALNAINAFEAAIRGAAAHTAGFFKSIVTGSREAQEALKNIGAGAGEAMG